MKMTTRAVRAGGHAAIVAAFAGLAVGTARAQLSITHLDVLAGGSPTFSYATAISADGLVVTGDSSSAAGERAFRWTAGGGMQSLGVLSGFSTFSTGQALSADGSVIACISTGAGSTARACRWTAATGMQSLGVLGTGSASYARAVSADGSIIVGSSYTSGFNGSVSARWTAATGLMSNGGTGSTCAAITSDGSVAGGTDNVNGFSTATRWTSPGVLQHLSVLTGADSAEAFAISADGSMAAGYSGDQFNGTYDHAARWTGLAGGGGVIQDLDAQGGLDFSFAYAMSADGSVVVGSSSAAPGDHAFLWTSALGMVNLNTYLPSLGLDLTGWTLTSATGISADGSAIVGYGTFNGADRAFLVRGYSACYANCDASTTAPMLNIADFTCFFQKFATGDSYANCDGSTAAPRLNVVDFTCYLQKFAQGCP
jgi:probable HAF family extracellular repeat protein